MTSLALSRKTVVFVEYFGRSTKRLFGLLILLAFPVSVSQLELGVGQETPMIGFEWRLGSHLLENGGRLVECHFDARQIASVAWQSTGQQTPRMARGRRR